MGRSGRDYRWRAVAVTAQGFPAIVVGRIVPVLLPYSIIAPDTESVKAIAAP